MREWLQFQNLTIECERLKEEHKRGIRLTVPRSPLRAESAYTSSTSQCQIFSDDLPGSCRFALGPEIASEKSALTSAICDHTVALRMPLPHTIRSMEHEGEDRDSHFARVEWMAWAFPTFSVASQIEDNGKYQLEINAFTNATRLAKFQRARFGIDMHKRYKSL